MTNEEVLNKSLRESGWNGHIGFSIKAKDTEQNQEVHKAFQDFSKMEAKNDHTLALRLLLSYWQDGAKIDAIWDYLKMLESRLAKLEELANQEINDEKKKDDKVMF